MSETLDQLTRRIESEWPVRRRVLDKFKGIQRAEALLGMLAGDIGNILNCLREAGELAPQVQEAVHIIIKNHAAGKPT